MESKYDFVLAVARDLRANQELSAAQYAQRRLAEFWALARQADNEFDGRKQRSANAQATMALRRERILSLIKSNPKFTKMQIASLLNISKGTIDKDFVALRSRLRKTVNGWEVLP